MTYRAIILGRDDQTLLDFVIPGFATHLDFAVPKALGPRPDDDDPVATIVTATVDRVDSELATMVYEAPTLVFILNERR